MPEESRALFPPVKESTEADSDPAEKRAREVEAALELANEQAFVCDCRAESRLACNSKLLKLPFYKEHDGKQYCVLHYPGKEKSADFKEAFERKLAEKDFDFRGVWFPDQVNFLSFDFGEGANFSYAHFSAEATFAEAKFSAHAVFYQAQFSEDARFDHSRFSAGPDFTNAYFAKDADFSLARFDKPGYFRSSIFNDSVKFLGYAEAKDWDDGVEVKGKALGKAPSLDFQRTKMEKPQRVSFQSLALRPHWFVNADPREFIFTDVDWQWGVVTIDEEIKSLAKKGVTSPYQLLAKACRQLAVNAEENHRYDEASKFRYWSMNALRKEKWAGFSPWRLEWWYWATSGFGERSLQALLILFGIWVVFALLYAQVGFSEWIKPTDTFFYSLYVMLLQKPDPRPATAWAKTWVLLETILGPIQAALFALAIRRKFMR